MPEFEPDSIPLTYLDTDGTLAANSDVKVASQKAVKTYADQIIAAADAMVFKGVIDCSANPNYPAADRGHTYRVSVAGKIGGGSGVNVEAGDLLLCLTDSTASGNQATVGTSWSIAQANLDGAVIGPASVTDSVLVRFDGTTGKLIKANGANGIALSEIVQADALSVLGVTGNATADLAAILFGTDGNILRRAGTSVAAGAIDLSLAGAVGSTILGLANGGTGQATAADAILALLPSQSGNSGKALVTNGTIGSWGFPSLPQSHVWVHTGNGYGSSGTKIRRWSTIKHNVGTAITYADSSTAGGSFTINESGYYSIVRTDYLSSGGVNIGLSVNSNQLSTSLGSITSSHYLNNAASSAANFSGIVAWTDYFEVGDVIRAHDSATVADGNNFLVSMNIIKIGV